MINSIARLVTRGDEINDGLIIGTMMRHQKFFKPNRVYEIREIMGEFIIVDVGEAVVSKIGEKDGPYQVSWGWSISNIIDTLGKFLFLTRTELKGIK